MGRVHVCVAVFVIVVVVVAAVDIIALDVALDVPVLLGIPPCLHRISTLPDQAHMPDPNSLTAVARRSS